MSKKYNSFISYSHQDSKWGEWLHKELEKFSIFKEHIDKANGNKTLYPIFRDRAELPSSSSLNDIILDALQNSDAMIVICSPNAAKSQWVNEEIKLFKKLHGEDKIFALIIEGEPNATSNDKFDDDLEAFPKALRYEVDANGELDEEKATEPVAADAREIGDGKERALIRIIAGLLGVGFEDLWQREKKRKKRNLVVYTSVTVTVISFILGIAYFAYEQKEQKEFNNRKIEANIYAVQVSDSIQKLKENLDHWSASSGETPLIPPKFRLPLDLTSKSIQATLKQDKYITPQTRNALIKSITYAPPWEAKLEHNSSVEAISWNDDQTQLATLDYDSNITIWDMEKYEVIKKYSVKNILKNNNDNWVINSSISWCGNYIFMLFKYNSENEETQTITLDVNSGTFTDISPSNLNIQDSSCNKATNQFAFIAKTKDTCQLRISDIDKPEKSYIFKNFKCDEYKSDLAWSPDGKFLATVGSDLSLWYVNEKKLLNSFPYTNVTWGSSSTELIVTEQNETVFNISKLEYDSDKDVFFEKPRLVYDIDKDDYIEKTTIKADVIKNDYEEILTSLQTVASPNLRWLATSYGKCARGNRGAFCENIVIQILDIQTGKVVKELFGHTSPITSLLWSQNSDMLVSTSNYEKGYLLGGTRVIDKFVRVWKVYPLSNLNDWSNEIVPPFEYTCGIRWNDMNTIDVAASPSDSAMAHICNYEYGIPLISWSIKNKIWNISGWSNNSSYAIGSQVGVQSFSISDSISHDRTTEQHWPKADQNFSISDSVSHDSKSELYWSGKNQLYPEYNASLYYLDDYIITIRNRQYNKEIKLIGHTDIIYMASWSHDDKRILTSSKDGTVRIFNALNGEELIRYDVDVNSGKSVAWSPDDKRIAILFKGGSDGSPGKIKVFPTMDDEVLLERLEHLRQAAPSLGEGAEDASNFSE